MFPFPWSQDQARAATRRLLWMFALAAVFTAVAVNLAMALAWKFQQSAAVTYPHWFFELITAVTLGVIGAGAWFQLHLLKRGGAHIAEGVGGQLLSTPTDGVEQRLVNVVHEMSIAAGIPPPCIWVLEREDAINAFAAGWKPDDCVVALTRGALAQLSRDELQGMMAHELSHIVHGDTHLNLRLIVCAFGLEMVFNLGSHLARMTDARGNRMVWSLLGFGLMVVGSAGWFFGRVLKAAVARQREFLADASAIQLTRNPSGIGGALQKIAGHKRENPQAACIHHSQADVLSHLFFAEAQPSSWKRWIAAHPSVTERLVRIYGHPVAPLRSRLLLDSSEDRMGVLPSTSVAALTKAIVPSLSERMALLGPCSPPSLVEHQAEAWLRLAQVHESHVAFAMAIGFLERNHRDNDIETWSEIVLSPFDFPVEVQCVLRSCLQDLRSLPTHASTALFEGWCRSCCALDQEHKRLFCLSASKMTKARGDNLSIWFLMVMKYLIQPAVCKVDEHGDGKTLQQASSAVAQITTHVSILILFAGNDSDVLAKRTRWCAAVHKELHLRTNVEIQDENPEALFEAMDEVKRAGWMERPKLVKALYRHARDQEGPNFETGPSILAIRSLCTLLDTPLPSDMVTAFFDPKVLDGRGDD